MSNRKGESDNGPLRVDVEQSHRISEVTIAHYDRLAEAYWDGTREHDVSRNYTALQDAIEGDPPYSILDLGCGPGRDLHQIAALNHPCMDTKYVIGAVLFLAVSCLAHDQCRAAVPGLA